MRLFFHRLLIVTGVLTLVITALAAAATAGDDTLPTNRMTNMGEERMVVFQGHRITPPGERGAGSILYAPSDPDNADFRNDLAACTGATVDYFDTRVATPDLALLSGYDCVFTWVDFPYLDGTAFGDVLADYVDAGGKVILGQWCYHSDQTRFLSGRIMTSAYCPITSNTSYDFGSYNIDGSDCVHVGVASYYSYNIDRATLLGGAEADGTFDNPANSLAVAWRADRMVYYSPGNTGATFSTGDWATVTGNMYLCDNASTLPRIVTGPGPVMANPPRVRTWNPDNPSFFIAEWAAYGVDQFGVNVACGDLDRDGKDSVVTGAGPGAVFGPHVRGFSGDGTPVAGVTFLAYGTHKYGVNVACGDLDGDGYDEIVTGAGPGAVFGPHVRGWNVDGGTAAAIPGISYLAYGTPKWGVNVACGDLDGDGYDEIVTGAGPGTVYGPHVRGWNYDNSAIVPIGGVSFLAYGTNQWGVNVGCGDIDGDGIDEIVTGAGPGVVFGPHVRGWNVDGGTAAAMGGVSFFAYTDSRYGVFVATVDLDGDGYDEILTMPGPSATQPARVRAWNVDGGTASQITSIDFDAYGDMGLVSGGKIAGGKF